MSKQSLSEILRDKFLKKGDNGKNPRLQNKDKLNNTGNNKEMMTYTVSKDGTKIDDVAPKTTAAKSQKLNVKKVFEGVISKLDSRSKILDLTGNVDQTTNARRVLNEAHGMMSRFAREYEERKLKFHPPTNINNPNEQTDNKQSDGDYENRFKEFQNKVNSMTNDNVDNVDNDDMSDTDNMDNKDDDVEMSFGATGADDYQDVTDELTIGDIINNVIDAIKANPEISVKDAFTQALNSKSMSEDDVEYRDEADDSYDYDDQQTDNQPFDDNEDDRLNQQDMDQDSIDGNTDPVEPKSNDSIKNNPLNKNPTQMAQRSDGSLMGFRRM